MYVCVYVCMYIYIYIYNSNNFIIHYLELCLSVSGLEAGGSFFICSCSYSLSLLSLSCFPVHVHI